VTFEDVREKAVRAWAEFEADERRLVLVGTGTCGRAAGADELIEAIAECLPSLAPKARICEVGCLGLCYAEPLVELRGPGLPRVLYGGLSPEDAPGLLDGYFGHGNVRHDRALAVMDGPAADGIPAFDDLPMIKGQLRIVLRNAGRIDPENVEHYIARGGYAGLAKALSMSPDDVIQEVEDSGLRGRGGAGFPTGVKWSFCRRAPGDRKYMICNADEGDPGAFMDRSVIESDPHSVIEGLAIAAYAIGAAEGYVYVRAEYPLAIERLNKAIAQARELGLLGESVMGSQFRFDVKLKVGAGAFVCGEETALLASIEGKRGMPRPRPPFPAQRGLHDCPTNINNVETLATVPVILERGSGWLAQYGTERSRGTKTFALAGKINRTGLIEVPLGTTLQQIVFDIGGGVPNGKRLKAVQTGGPSGGCIPAAMLSLPVDYERLTEAGSIMGSGGMIVMDEDTCMVDIARYFVEFTQSESCGKCVPCRLGTRQMLGILNDITSGRGKPEHLDVLNEIARAVKLGSLCGLGQTAPNPVLTTLRHFRDEYEAHIEGKCPAAVCPGLVSSPCKHTCPAGVDVPRYIRCIAAGRYADALDVIREKIPFPGVCGRVCFHPCESKCRRALLDDPVAVRALKRFAAERGADQPARERPAAEPTGKSVAVVGSGPAGLTAGYYLARLGHRVVVHEREAEPGGTLRTGIPPFRLPREVIDRDIQGIRNAGVEIRTGTSVASLEELLNDGFDAVVLACGALKGLKMGIPGEDDSRVLDCLSFLKQVNAGIHPGLGKRVAVVGGGSSAMDAARTALRLGAEEVTVLYRRTRQEMPAAPEEVDQALAEGARIEFLTAPTAVRSERDALKLNCVRMELGAVDASGRRRPLPIADSEFEAEVDSVIMAIGQQPEAMAAPRLETDRRGRLQVDRLTHQTDCEGVFGAGDMVTGPASIIEAIAAGRKVAAAVDEFLGGTGDIDEVLAPPEDTEGLATLEEQEERRRVQPRLRQPGASVGDFDEVELSYTEEEALLEASRCLRCDLEESEEE